MCTEESLVDKHKPTKCKSNEFVLSSQKKI